MIWARMLAYITGSVDQELLLRNEYLAAENRILRAQIKGRLLLSDAEKATLAEIAHRLGRKALEELAAVAKPDTLLAWYRKLIATKTAAPSPAAIRGTLPRGAQSPGQAEPTAVPIAESRGERAQRNCALQGTTGWSAEVL